MGLRIISNRRNHRYGFPKQVRLLRSADFRRVYDTGRRRNLDYLVAFALETGNPSRIGFAVPRAVGGSVERNKVKRRLREAVRKHLELLGAGWDVVLNARASSKDRSWADIEATVANYFASLRARRTPGGSSVDGSTNDS